MPPARNIGSAPPIHPFEPKADDSPIVFNLDDVPPALRRKKTSPDAADAPLRLKPAERADSPAKDSPPKEEKPDRSGESLAARFAPKKAASDPPSAGSPPEKTPVAQPPVKTPSEPLSAKTPVQAAASPRGRIPPVYTAAAVGALFASASLLGLYLILRPSAPPTPKAAVLAAPTAPAPTVPFSTDEVQQSPAPILDSSSEPNDDSRPTATFSNVPRVIVTSHAPASVPKAAPPPTSVVPKAPVEQWKFEGEVFDVLTGYGVFAAALTFLDAKGNLVGKTNTGTGGRYKISIPAGTGYMLKISAADYTDRYIDDDPSASMRDATPQERMVLMRALPRAQPWAGNPKKAVRRDLGLVPQTQD